MGRGLLFQCQLPWRGRLSHPDSKTQATYAVLAILSDCYPPLKGRLPTCYSPVRHFTQSRSPFLVRLACVRPAANVRSEPGSNSPVKSTTTADLGLLRRLVAAFDNSRMRTESEDPELMYCLLGTHKIVGVFGALVLRRETLRTFRTWFAIQLSETDATNPWDGGKLKSYRELP